MKKREHNLKRDDLVWSTGGYWMSPPAKDFRPAKLIQGRYVAYHRMIVEQKIGRRLRPGECVAFKDGDQNNLKSSNFVLTDRKGLASLRPRVKKDSKCLRCKKGFHVSPSAVSHGGGKFCSWECRYPK